MKEERPKRKLTAILSADVKGYSRLMADDEEATVQTINAYRNVMTDLIKEHNGRVVDAKGDNVLAEFASVVDAVRCSVQVQNDLKERNSELPEHRRMEFRIGINLGDVIEEEGTLYGDGVNVAARLEGLAEGGGICLSGTAFDQVKNRISVGYEYGGKQSVKNLPDPVRVYKVLLEPEAAGKVIGEKEPEKTRWGWKAVAAAAVLVLVAGGIVWNFYWRAPKIEPASEEKMAFPLPDKPSIAVLPFTNMTGDASQEFLVDGLTENLITALARVPQLFVIARNSTFIYKNKGVKVQQVAEELGIQYVLEGSVQRSGNKVRITAQFIDALKGHHLWADQYDREMKELFQLTDEVTNKVINSVYIKITGREEAQLRQRKAPKNTDSLLKTFEVVAAMRGLNPKDNAQAKRLAEELATMDPDWSGGVTLLARAYFMEVVLGYSRSPKESLAKALELAQKAVAMDESSPTNYDTLGYVYSLMGEHERALIEFEKGSTICPSCADSYMYTGYAQYCLDETDKAIASLQTALRLNPYPPPYYYLHMGNAYRHVGRYEDAISWYKKALQVSPNIQNAYLGLASCYSLLGSQEEARSAAQELLRVNPKFTVEAWAKTMPYKNQEKLVRYADALRKAGLPDKPPLPLPDKPSIVVLPFVNMSEDKSQEFFSDGLTEEIITALSKTPKLFVIARNSTFVYKGKPVNVQQVSRELGVRYVLEGSVRRSGDQLRITAQLIDGKTGNHLWAERYDRELKDLFTVQDEVTMRILTFLQVALTEGEQAKFFAKGTKSLEAYLKCLEARELLLRLNKDDTALSIERSEEAIALDPQYARAFASLSSAYSMNFYFRVDPAESFRKAYENAQKALALDDTQLAAYIALEFAYGWRRQYDEAIAAGEKAIKVAPGSADAYLTLGRALNMACRDKEAIEYVEKAIRLNPFPPTHYYMHLGFANYHLRNYDQAVSAFKKALSQSPRNQPARGALIATYVEMERMEEARAEADELLRIDPKWTSKGFEKMSPYRDPEVTRRRAEAWRKLGLERDVSSR